MRCRLVAPLVAAVLTIGAGAAALAAPGSGTYTRITSPGSIIYKLDSVHPTANTLKIVGVTSPDVTSVDIVCIYLTTTDSHTSDIASNVAVTSGRFSVTAVLTDFVSTCRLRAIPSDAAPDAYTGSYSGPILRANTFKPFSTGGVVDGYLAIAEQGTGAAGVADAGSCGAELLLTIEMPAVRVDGVPEPNCTFALPPRNVTASGTATASALKVDGHNAYLPSGVDSYLNSNLSLGVTQPKLTTTFVRYANGDVRVTESATVMRCSVSDTYPPTTTSCPALVSTGVVFKRIVDLFRGDHQIRLRDSFTSTAAAHSVSAQYFGAAVPPDTGSTGYVFPGHGTAALGVRDGQVVTGLGTKAASLLVRSDRFAAADEPSADTRALSWSKAPSRIQFATPSYDFGLAYSLSVPAHRGAYLGFAESEAPTNTAVTRIAASALHEMVAVPSISSPAAGAHVQGKTTVVKGSVTAGANGLPTAVSVNGHKATLIATSATAATWKVTFSESYAAHTIKVTATDDAGNTAAKSISVRNVKP